jgi:hypothetical protein
MAIGQSRLHTLMRKGKILSDAVAWFEAFTPRNKKEILDLIREDQLRDKGIDGNNNEIGFYSFATQLASDGKKQQGDHYTLDDTGAFFRSMFIRVLSDRFTINADGQKEDDNLFDKYGQEIIKLTDENIDKIKIIIRRAYITYVRKILFESR